MQKGVKNELNVIYNFKNHLEEKYSEFLVPN